MLQIDLRAFARDLRSELESRYSDLEEAVAGYADSGDMLRDLGDEAREIIIERTAELKVDADGRPFAPYSPRYALTKRRSTGYSGPPNLRLSGRMLDEISLRQTGPLAGTLTFASARSAEIAAVHNEGRWPQPRRRFFAIGRGSADAARLRERALQELDRRLQAHGLK